MWLFVVHVDQYYWLYRYRYTRGTYYTPVHVVACYEGGSL